MAEGLRDNAGTGTRTVPGAALPERLAAAVTALRNRPIPATEKGFGRIAPAGLAFANPAAGSPPPGGPVTAARLAAERPPLLGGGFDMPVLVLREAALRQNIEAMAAYCAAAGVLHAPHGKTTMAPQLIGRQLAAGAWAVTAATIAHAQVYRAFGVPRVLIANQLTERGAAEWLARELAADPGFDCYVYADSLAGVALLDQAAASVRPGRPLKVLVELGYPGGRPGAGASPTRWPSPPRSSRPPGSSWPGPRATRAASTVRTRRRPWPRSPRSAPICARWARGCPARRRAAGTSSARAAARTSTSYAASCPRPGPGRSNRPRSCCAAALTSRTITGATRRPARAAVRERPLPGPLPSRSSPRRSSCGRPCCRCRSPASRSRTPAGATSPTTRECRCRCASARPGRAGTAPRPACA